MSGTLGGLPRIQAQERQRPVGPPAMVNVGDFGAGALAGLARSANAIAADFSQQADTLATEHGRQDGAATVIERDPGTGLPVAPAMSSGLTPYDRSRDAAARAAYLDTSKQDALTAFTRMAGEERYRTDPQAFLAAAQADAQARAAAAPEWARGELGRELDGIAQGMGRRAMAEWSNVQLRQQANAWQMQVATYGDEVRALAFQGVAADAPEMVAARARLVAQLERGVAAGHISGEQRTLLAEQTATEALAMGVAGQAQRIAETQGPEAARRFLDTALADPRLAAAGDRALGQARAMGDRAIGHVRVERQFGQQEVRESINGLAQNQRAGVRVDAATWERAAQRADAAGLPQVAREARALGQIGGEVAALAGAGLEEIAAARQRALQPGPAGVGDPLNGMRAVEFGRLIEAQTRALAQDPVGWADTQPTVRAVLERAAKGEATIADVVRARDAVLAPQMAFLVANNVPAINAAVIPRAEQNRLSQIIATAPPSGQKQALEQVFLAYPPELRFRIWNDLTSQGGGGNIPASLRPAMLLMTSEQTREGALSRFLAAAQMSEQDRTNAAGGPDAMRKMKELIRNRMAEFSATGGAEASDYFRDVGAAVEAVALMSPGRDESERVAVAWNMVVNGHVQMVRAGGSMVRVPLGQQVDGTALGRAMDGVIWSGDNPNWRGPRIEPAGLVVPPGAVPPRPGLTEEARQKAYYDAMRERGRWLSLPDGTGVIRTDGEGRPVRLTNGQYFVLRFGEERTQRVASMEAVPATVISEPPVARPVAPPAARRGAAMPRDVPGQPPLAGPDLVLPAPPR